MSSEKQRNSAVQLAGALALSLALVAAPATLAQVSSSSSNADVGVGEFDTGALAGHWKLNKEQSDDPSELRPQGRGGRGGGRGGGFGGGPSGGPGGDRGGRPGGPGDSGDGPSKLAIVHGADEIVVTDGRGRERSYCTDGCESTVEGPRGDEINESAQWTGEALVVSSNGSRGESTETFRINADGQLEIIHERPESEDRPAIELRRVYDRVENQ